MNPRKAPHLCLIPSISSNKGNLNLKNVGFRENVYFIMKFIYIPCKFKLGKFILYRVKQCKFENNSIYIVLRNHVKYCKCKTM